MAEPTERPTKRPTKRRIEAGESTNAKVARKSAPREAVKKLPSAEDTSAPAVSSRYTPPTGRYEDLPSPIWVPVLMFLLWGLGMLTIFLNYVGMLPGATSNWYLLLGLGFILGGIITATQFR